jgi:hypothetical protein
MIHVTKELDFSQSPFSIDYIVKCITDLLNSNLFVRIKINSSTKKKHRSSERKIISNKQTSNSSMLLVGLVLAQRKAKKNNS